VPAVQIELDEFLRLSAAAAAALTANGFPVLVPPAPTSTRVEDAWFERVAGRAEPVVLH
jgi:hypothetical protein